MKVEYDQTVHVESAMDARDGQFGSWIPVAILWRTFPVKVTTRRMTTTGTS